MRLRILPYKAGSKTARALARSLNTLCIKPFNSKFRAKVDDIIINWGSNFMIQGNVLNSYEKIAVIRDKRLFFRKYRQLPIPVESFQLPDSTEDIDQAKEWLSDEHKVYCRTIVNGQGGSGIVVASTMEELVPAPLYTKRFPNKYEYRIHVFRGKIIDMVKKGIRQDANPDERNPLIRNHANGYIFIREGVIVPEEVKSAVLSVIPFYNLDFGAVDIGWHPEKGACVFEINSAPGLEGTSLQAYTNAIQEYVNAL